MVTKIIDAIVNYFMSKIMTYELWKWLRAHKYDDKEEHYFEDY